MRGSRAGKSGRRSGAIGAGDTPRDFFRLTGSVRPCVAVVQCRGSSIVAHVSGGIGSAQRIASSGGDARLFISGVLQSRVGNRRGNGDCFSLRLSDCYRKCRGLALISRRNGFRSRAGTVEPGKRDSGVRAVGYVNGGSVAVRGGKDKPCRVKGIADRIRGLCGRGLDFNSRYRHGFAFTGCRSDSNSQRRRDFCNPVGVRYSRVRGNIFDVFISAFRGGNA